MLLLTTLWYVLHMSLETSQSYELFTNILLTKKSMNAVFYPSSTLICLLKYSTHEATLGIKLTKGSGVILDFITYLSDPIEVTP